MSYGAQLPQELPKCANKQAASPYLLSLGLSKSSMAIVFIAGPVSGLIMQPLIGEFIYVFLLRFSWAQVFWPITVLHGSGDEGLT